MPKSQARVIKKFLHFLISSPEPSPPPCLIKEPPLLLTPPRPLPPGALPRCRTGAAPPTPSPDPTTRWRTCPSLSYSALWVQEDFHLWPVREVDSLKRFGWELHCGRNVSRNSKAGVTEKIKSSPPTMTQFPIGLCTWLTRDWRSKQDHFRCRTFTSCELSPHSTSCYHLGAARADKSARHKNLLVQWLEYLWCQIDSKQPRLT